MMQFSILKSINPIRRILAQAPVELGPIRGEGPLGLAQEGPEEGGTMFANVLSKVIGIMTFAAGVWFIIQIIVAGYNFISSGGDSQKIQEAQKRIVNSIIGLALVVVSVLFLSLIGHLLHVEFLDIANIIERLSP